MAYPGPRNPEENFPVRAITKIVESKEADNNETNDEIIAPKDLLLLVVAALRVLKNEDGSTMNEIRRILISGGFITPSLNIRPALILGLKKNVLRRPLSAIKANAYGRYIEVEKNAICGTSTKRRTKSLSGGQILVRKKVKRCHKTNKRSVERYRLAL